MTGSNASPSITENNAAAAPVARPSAGKNIDTVGARTTTATAPASVTAISRTNHERAVTATIPPSAPASAGSDAR